MTQAARATSMKRGLLGMALAAAVALVLVICLGRTGQAPSATPSEREVFALLDRAQDGAAQGEKARTAVRALLGRGRPLPEKALARLVAIDMALDDREGLERDAREILRRDPCSSVGNAALGEVLVGRCEFAEAERHLRLAVAGAKPPPAVWCNLAVAVAANAREKGASLDEAEAFARKATEAQPGNWRALETLAAVLLRGGRTDEGARLLAEAEELAAKAKVDTSMLPSVMLDRAYLAKARGDTDRLAAELRKLGYLKNPPAALRRQIEEVAR